MTKNPRINPSTLGWSLEYLLFENLLSHCHFVCFLQGYYLKSIEHWRPDLGDPPKRRVPKYLPKWDPAGGTLALSPSGGGGEKLFKNHGFFSFFDWGMVIQITFQIEDNLYVMQFIFQIEDIRGVLKHTFQIEDNISWGNPESSTKWFSNRRYSFATPWVRQIPNAWKTVFK